MPITQDRLHSAVIAARGYKTLYEDTRQMVIEEFNKIASGRTDAATAYADLYSRVMMTPVPPQYTGTIEREEMHYKHTVHVNKRKKAHMQRRRGAGHHLAPLSDGERMLPPVPLPAGQVDLAELGLGERAEVILPQSGDEWAAIPDAPPQAGDAGLDFIEDGGGK